MTLGLHVILDEDQLAKIAERVAEILRVDQRPHESDRYVDVVAAAAFLGVSEERVRKLVARRSIPHFQESRGCRITFSVSDLHAWMQTHRHAPRGGDA